MSDSNIAEEGLEYKIEDDQNENQPEEDNEEHLASMRLENVKQVGNYYITKTIGEGAFSKVKLGIHIQNESKFAIKIMKKSRLIQEGMIEQVKREISFYFQTSSLPSFFSSFP